MDHRKRGNNTLDDGSSDDDDAGGPSQDLFAQTQLGGSDDDEIPEEDLTDPRGAELFASGDELTDYDAEDLEGSLPPPLSSDDEHRDAMMEMTGAEGQESQQTQASVSHVLPESNLP